jgi:hypothetical protein
MKTLTFGALVIVGACLYITEIAAAESGSAGSAGSDMSGMTSQGLASEPAGIGERGTGQTQSTLERSGVPPQKSMSSEAAGTAETQTSKEQPDSSTPSGVGEKGAGQSQRTSPSQSQRAMERPQ